MTVADRLMRLNEAFDVAHAAGVVEGIERCMRGGRAQLGAGLAKQAE